ncbi:MAG: GNAT family N-acetyltransferase [Pseudomonadota bacterium]
MESPSAIALDALPASFAASASQETAADVFATADWFRHLHQHGFDSPPELHVYTVHDGGAESPRISYLPLYCERAGCLRSLTNQYSIHYAAPFPNGHGSAVSESLVKLIAEETPSWSELDIRCLRAHAQPTIDLASGLERAGWSVFADHQTWNWSATVAGLSYSAFLAQRPGQLRSTLKRKGRRAASTHRVAFRILRDTNGLAQAIEDYQRIYEKCWKLPERCPRFIPGLMQLCAQSGALRLGLLYLDGQPAAAQFWIVSRDTAYIYKLAHDRDFDDISAGTLLSGAMFEYALDEDKVAKIDFGVGDEPYKQDWMDHRDQLIRLRAFNTRTLRGRLRAARLHVRHVLRRAGFRSYTPLAHKRQSDR